MPANIAEYYKRRNRAETARFQYIAHGSFAVCRYTIYDRMKTRIVYQKMDIMKNKLLLEEASRLFNKNAAKVFRS